MSHLLPECFPFDQIFFSLRYHWACNFNAGKRKHLGGSRDLTAVHTPFILLFKTRESFGDRQDNFNDLIEFQLKIFIANSCSSCLTSAESWGIEENVEILWLTGIFSSRDEWKCILFSLSLGSCFSLYPPRIHNKQTRRREPKIDTFTTFVRNDFFFLRCYLRPVWKLFQFSFQLHFTFVHCYRRLMDVVGWEFSANSAGFRLRLSKWKRNGKTFFTRLWPCSARFFFRVHTA